MINFIFSKKSMFATLFLFVILNSYAQNQTATKPLTSDEVIDYAEFFYGYDDRLLCGQIYQPAHFRAKGHPNFKNDEWQNGRVFIKGSTFEDLNLKYNVFINKLILKADFNSGNVRHVVLNSNFIDSLYIDKHLFINSSTLNINESSMFYEQLYKGSFKVFIKHNVVFRDDQSATTPFGKFLKAKHKIYLYQNDQIADLSSKKSFLSFFKLYQREIKKYIRKENFKFKKADNNQLYNLLKYCDEISSK